MNRRSFLCLFGKMVAPPCRALCSGQLPSPSPCRCQRTLCSLRRSGRFGWRPIQRGLPIMYMTLAASIFWLAARV